MSEPISVPLRRLSGITWSATRRGEPATFGVPLPHGAVRNGGEIAIGGPKGPVPVQVRALDAWPDGSIRWALIDTLLEAESGEAGGYAMKLARDAAVASDSGLRITSLANGVRVSTGLATFDFFVGGAFPLSSVAVGDVSAIEAGTSGLVIEHDGQEHRCRISGVTVRAEGPLRADLDVTTRAGSGTPLEVGARIEIFAGTATVRIAVTVRNPRRAQHAAGQWPLGDPGSVLLTSSRLVLALGQPLDRIRCAPEQGAPLVDVTAPFEIHQESSGGDHWNGPIHRNRDGHVPLRFRGYQVREGGRETEGRRASPIVVVDSGRRQLAVAIPHFWENFPQAIAASGSNIDIRFLPATSDVHELQGGEQKTHVVVIAFAEDRISDPPLAWVHDPIAVYPGPEWCCGTEVVPFLVPAAVDPQEAYLGIVSGAFDSSRGFFAKREIADEYGWRNFGDLPADHEWAFLPPGETLVSHYNNQYDPIFAFIMHFLRTGDGRWRRLCDDLARHVTDIDIYRTRQDKSAYNGGLFWHTNHYTDAGTATHRTYPRGGREGGGPSAEHNYNAGLMFHYFLTGDRTSRDVAVSLGRWVIDMEDGRLTPLRWLAAGPTGLASATGSATYHGPGRAAANSVIACLVALRLTREVTYLATAEGLIQRCVHPEQDLEELNLLDVERRWYYTVFLQALGVYLQVKEERGELDAAFTHAQASLLHYARWMAAHEQPYLSRPEQLEFPNETWPAQDIRKAEVFQWAALHSSGADRTAFLERAAFFFQYSVGTLAASPGRFNTRPLVLMLSNGFRYAALMSLIDRQPQPVRGLQALPPALPIFESQKIRAMRRAKWLVVMAAAVIVVIGGLAALAVFR